MLVVNTKGLIKIPLSDCEAAKAISPIDYLDVRLRRRIRNKRLGLWQVFVDNMTPSGTPRTNRITWPSEILCKINTVFAGVEREGHLPIEMNHNVALEYIASGFAIDG